MATRSKGSRTSKPCAKTTTPDSHFKRATIKDVEHLVDDVKDVAAKNVDGKKVSPTITHESAVVELSDSSQQSQSDRSTASPIIPQPQIVWCDGVSSPKLLSHKETPPIQPTSSTPYLRRIWRKQSVDSLSPKRMRMDTGSKRDENWLSEVHGLINRLENRSPTCNNTQTKKRLDMPPSTDSGKAEDTSINKLTSPEFDKTNPFADSLSFGEFIDETPSKTTKPVGSPPFNHKSEPKSPTRFTVVKQTQDQSPLNISESTAIKKEPSVPVINKSTKKPSGTPLRRYQSHDAILQNELIEQKRKEALKRLRNRSGRLLRHSSADSMTIPRSKPATQTQLLTSKTKLNLDKSMSPSDSIRKLTPPSSQESLSSTFNYSQPLSKTLKSPTEKVAVMSQLFDTMFPDDEEEDLILTQIIEREDADQSERSKRAINRSKHSKQTITQSKSINLTTNQSAGSNPPNKKLQFSKNDNAYHANDKVNSFSKSTRTSTLKANLQKAPSYGKPSLANEQSENQDILTIIEKKRLAALAKLKRNTQLPT